MGAAHSTPQTVTMENPVVITEEAIQRLEEHASKQTPSSDKCTEALPNIEPYDERLLWRKQSELDEKQFHKALEDVDSLLGAPVHWADQYDDDLKKFEKDLIQCYKKHPEETLHCANLAKEYQEYVYTKQFETILYAKNRKDNIQGIRE